MATASERNNKILDLVSRQNLPKYTYDQIIEAIYKKGVKTFDQITNVSKELRSLLSQNIGNILTLEKIQESNSEYASKILFKTLDGQTIETVKMNYKNHTSLCISTQVGCQMGCKFCATGAAGFVRDLSCDEIVDQVLYFLQEGQKIDTIIVSGMGEPFVNPNFFDALEISTDKKYLGFGARKISVSTVGIVPGITKLSKEYPQINIALSLHSPFQAERESLIPAGKSYKIKDIFHALDGHVNKNKRKVFLVYLLLREVNDSKEHAQALVKLIKERGVNSYLYHVNLMKFHPGDTTYSFGETNLVALKYFEETLKKNGINYTVRQDFGLGIDAACGQLRSRKI